MGSGREDLRGAVARGSSRFGFFFFFSSRRRHTRLQGDWSSDVCSSDLLRLPKRPSTTFPPPNPPSEREQRALGRRVGRFTQRGTSGLWLLEPLSGSSNRSEEGRVGEEGRSRGGPDHLKKKKTNNNSGAT